MDGSVWAIVGWTIAALELAAAITFFVLWRVAEGRRRSLRRELDGVPSVTRRARRALTPENAVRTVWETAVLVRDKGVSGAIRSSIADIAGWAEVERPALVQLAGDDGCVAIMFSDIEGSTELNERLGDRGWMKLLRRHDETVLTQVRQHDGLVVKHQGDGYMLAFPDAESAVECAIGVQRALRRPRQSVRVRIGIHYGSVVHRDNDIFGRNVAMAARIAGVAGGGEVLISAETAEELSGQDLEARLDDTFDVELKGISGRQLVASVRWN